MLSYKIKSVIAGLAVISCSQLAFSEILPLPHPDGIAWTNDDGNQSSWELMGDVFTQTTPNKDKEPWGDKYYIIPDVLDSVSQDQYTISVDLLALDYAGGTGLWQGLLIGLDEDNPAFSEKVAVLIEKSEKVGYCGLRIHHNGAMSELVPVEQPLLQWLRLVVEVQDNSTISVKVLDESNASQNSTTDWDLVYELDQPISLNNTAVAIGAAAEFGFETNPRVGFSNLLLSRSASMNRNFKSISEVIDYQNQDIEHLSEVYSHQMVHDPSIHRRILEVKNHSNKLISTLRLKNTSASEALADNISRLNKITGHILDPTSPEDYFFIIQKLFLKKSYFTIDQRAIEFKDSFPNDPLVWEVTKRQLHALSKLEPLGDRYEEVFDEVLTHAPDEFIIDAIYNKTVLLQDQERSDESRLLLLSLMEDYNVLTSSVWNSYLDTYLEKNELEELREIAEFVTNTRPA